MLCECGGKSEVVHTKQITDGVWRRRRCVDCSKKFHTVESLVESVRSGRKPSLTGFTKPDARGLYTPDGAAIVASTNAMKKVDTRRSNEDHRETDKDSW